MAEARILIVEDEELVAGEIQNVLLHLGYAVEGVMVSGEEAIAYVETTRPDVILMDITLCGNLNGIETADRIHERFDIPIIYLTAHDDEATLQQAKITEPFGYIIKPFRPRELHSTIEITLYRYRMEHQLRDMNRQLQEASRLKSDFLANMSHELRTPLNAMIGYTSLTLNAVKDLLPPEHLQNLTRAEQSARTLLQLINDVLDFSKIEAGRLHIFVEDIDLQDVLDEVLSTAEGLVGDKPLTLQMECAPNLPVMKSDFSRLKQILDNLVGNAVKFTPAGVVTVRARLVEGERRVRIEVEDTGSGIPPAFLGNLFQLFRQADGSIKKQFGGTGLGLAIVKRLCDMLGIQIGVQTESAVGTLFWLNVPLDGPQVLTPGVAAQSIPSSVSTPQAPSVQQSATPSEAASFARELAAQAEANIAGRQRPTEPDVKALVLCFCGKDMRGILQRHLAGLPLEVAHVQSVAECVAKRKAQIIWTVMLEADEHGFETLTQLKAEASLQDVPIIMASPEKMPQGFPLGPLEYLEKPVDHKKLLGSLLRMTRVRQGEVLVVDDDKDIRTLYARVLSKEGYTTYLASNGLEALEQLRQHPSLQAIVLDLMMPGMDGFQVIEHLQQHAEWRKIPVMVVTAKALSADERAILRQGAQLLLEKGKFSLDDLSERLNSVMRSVTLAGMRSILVIDDNEMNLNLTASVFESAGHRVYMARSAREGLEIARQMHPDAIVMDLAMPGMDGFEATQLLKQNPATADITVIACSAFATQEYQERAFQVGCEGYLTKPIEPHRLIEQVTKYVLSSKIRKKMAASVFLPGNSS